MASNGSGKYYIQSALSLPDAAKEAQEKRTLYRIDDSFTKLIITKNGLHVRTDEKGVTVMDLFHFLMSDDFVRP